MWETKPEMGVAGNQTLTGLGRGEGELGALQGIERKGPLL